MRSRIRSAVALACASMTMGCGNMFVGPRETARPQLPDPVTMSVPAFTPRESQGLSKSAAGQASVTNVVVAYLAVAKWTDTVAEVLAPAVALFKLCHRQTPVALEDNSGWRWSVSALGYTADLVGRVEDDSARWTMTVQGNGLSDFLWFNGSSTITGNAGYWTFNEKAAGGAAAVPAIEFSYNRLAEDVGSVTVTVVKSADPAAGSSLRWQADGDQRSFAAVGVQNNTSVLISWSKAGGDGFILDRSTNRKYCWDTRANGYADRECE